VIQSAILTVIVIYGKCAPTRGAVLLGSTSVELFVDIAATCVAPATLGLALAALARSNEQILPMLVISVMLSIVFCGGMIPVTARPILDRCPGPHRPAGVSPPERPQPTFRCSNPGRSAPKTRTVHTHPRGCSTWRCWSRTACSTPCLCAGRSG